MVRHLIPALEEIIPEEHLVINRPNEVRAGQYVPWISYCAIQTVKGRLLHYANNLTFGKSKAIRRAQSKIWVETLDTLVGGIHNYKYITPEGKIEPLTPDFFRDNNNWVNNAFNLFLFDRVESFLGSSDEWPKIAHFTLSNKQLEYEERKNRLKGGAFDIYNNLPEEYKYWTDTKEVSVGLTESTFKIRLTYKPDITRDLKGRQVSKPVCRWNKAVDDIIPNMFNKWWDSILRNWRTPPAHSAETMCVVDNNDPYCEFDGTYENRIRDPIIRIRRRQYLAEDAEIIKEHAERLEGDITGLKKRIATVEGRAEVLAREKTAAERARAEEAEARLAAERKQNALEREVAAQSALARTSRKLYDMAAGILHRSKNVFDGVEALRTEADGLAQLIRKRYAQDPELAANAGFIEMASPVLRHGIAHVNELHGILLESSDPNPERFKDRHLYHDLQNYVRIMEAGPAKHIAFKLRWDAKCKVQEYTPYVWEIFEELLTNARKAIERGNGRGEILIQGAELSDRLRVSVSDTGDGIKAELIPHLFTRTDIKPHSMGRGLETVYSYARDAGGNIIYDPANIVPGYSTTFSVELPKVV